MNRAHSPHCTCRLPAVSVVLACLVLCVAVAGTVRAQAGADRDDRSRVASASQADGQPVMLDGIWPTKRMTQSLLLRLAENAADEYDLRPDQQKKVEALLLDRWPRFLDENRRQLQPLINEFFEHRFAMQPPSSDEVADWAKRAMPVFRRLRHQIEEDQTLVRDFLNPAQQAKLDMDRIQLSAGFELFESNLKRWSVGSFNQHEWWEPTPRYSRAVAEQKRAQAEAARAAAEGVNAARAAQERAAQERAAQEATFMPPQRVLDEFEAWRRYVTVFCDRYDLDRSQRNAAESILREMLNRAKDHVFLHRDRITAVEQMIQNTVDAEESNAVAEMEALYKPLDDMFHELDERLHRLPTSAQMRRADAQIKPELDEPTSDQNDQPAEPAPPVPENTDQ